MKSTSLLLPTMRRAALLLAAAALAVDCSGKRGSRGATGTPGSGSVPDTPTDLSREQNAPGIVLQILAVSGAGNSDGTFKVGDKPSVTFTIKKNDGTDWNLDEMARGRILMSGPTFNYQRVLAEQTDVLTASVKNSDGSYTYTFANAIPATYLAPLNDSASFGAGDGELSGQALVAGTYTIGLYTTWNYTVDGASFSDAANVEQDVLFGNASTLEPREVVTQANCNACHSDLRVHGGMRRDVKLCVLCHTAGSEDKNDATEGGTPGRSVQLSVMIHKIHNGEHLPSVLGVATNSDGSRNYAATPEPYKLVGFQDNVSDFSDVAFPVWPNLNIAMPRDSGYTGLSSGAKLQEDTIRMGVTACAKCHGDPDGAGPLPAPNQGDVAYSQPSRQACGACHDDIDWTNPYTSNTQTMPAQNDDSACILCHDATDNGTSPGTSLAVLDAHRHPLLDSHWNPGFNVTGLTVAEAGTNDGDGTIDPGEQIALTFSLTDDTGAAVAPSALTSLSAAISGPTSNYNIIVNTSIPTAALTGSPPYTINLTEPVQLEYTGDAANNSGIEVFTTARNPHIITGATTTVFERTATSGGNTTLAADVALGQNYIDVADTTGFAHNDYLVIDDGVVGSEEYLRVQYVQGTRLWFGSTASTAWAFGPRVVHSSGATVKEVTLTTKSGTTDYILDAVAGTVTERNNNSFLAGDAVIVTYTTNFIMPATYPVAINGSPDLDESWGKWTAKTLVDGTYTIGVWGAPNRDVALWGETQTYRGTSPPANVDFLVGSATQLESYDRVAGASACNSCHDDLYFHGGGRRGFDTCIVCHGGAGGEDRSQYVAANAPATTGVTISFRTMLHKIHMGANLANASTYTVVGFGALAWPDNYGTAQYSEVEFPALPNGPATCVACHGADNTAWYNPATRNHPTDQTLPTRSWRAACGACHDSDAAAAHIDVNTSPTGYEACAVCHGADRPEAVILMHKAR